MSGSFLLVSYNNVTSACMSITYVVPAWYFSGMNAASNLILYINVLLRIESELSMLKRYTSYSFCSKQLTNHDDGATRPYMPKYLQRAKCRNLPKGNTMS